MAGQPGKKVKQDISTFLATAKNLQQPGQGEPLKNAFSDITKNVTQAKETAGQQAQTKTQDVANKTSKDTLAAGTQVNQSGYTPPKVIANTSGVSAGGIASSQGTSVDVYLGDVGAGVSNATADLNTQGSNARQIIADTATGFTTSGEAFLSPLEKLLNQGDDLVTDGAGNIIGSNRSIGLVAAPSTTETLAGTRQAMLAQQEPNSNIDALSALLGYNYDPRTAALGSQVYQGDIAGIRGQAKADVEQSTQAEAGRQRSVEDYLSGLTEGKTRVGEARTELGKNVDKFKTDADTALDKQIADEQTKITAAGKDARGQVGTIQNRANVETVQKAEKTAQSLVDGIAPSLISGIAKFFSERPDLRGTYSAERMADELLGGANYGGGNLRGILGSIRENDNAITGTSVTGYTPKTTRDLLILLLTPIAAKYGNEPKGTDSAKAPNKGSKPEREPAPRTDTGREEESGLKSFRDLLGLNDDRYNS